MSFFPARNTGYAKFRISELNIPSEHWLTVSDGNFCFERICSWLFEVIFKYLCFFPLYTRLKFFSRANHFQSGESYPHLQNDVSVLTISAFCVCTLALIVLSEVWFEEVYA